MRERQVAWVLYDAANSGFGLIVLGPVFASGFIGTKLPEGGLTLFGQELAGSTLLALMASVAALLITLGAPLLGALADGRGMQRGLFRTFGITGGVVGLAFLFAHTWQIAAVVYVLGFACFGFSNTFYNAYLPKLAPPSRQGSLSGWGFAIGYLGGAAAMVIALAAVARLELPIRYAWAFGGLWWLALGTPAFILMPKVPATATLPPGNVVIASAKRIVHTFAQVRLYPMLFLFLAAFLLYANGTDTIINLSSAFAADVLEMEPWPLARVFLVIQCVAFVGALVAGYVADRVGNKPVIVATLLVWCVGTMLMYFVETPTQFLVLGSLVGLVLGGVQSCSRALMAKLAPEAIRNEAFGFFALGNKAAAVFGPLLFAGFALIGGPRFGVFAVLPFLVVGLVILLRVREPGHEPLGH
ncbi:MAG: MFS transporter [Planctomycetota bacterium]